jgi:GNAT superfamily N-acetyltransferase
VEYRTPGPEDAEALQFNVVVGFDGYREFAPPGWEPPDELTPESVERTRAGILDPDAFALMAVHGESPVGHVLWVPARNSRAADAPRVPGLIHLQHLFVLPPWWGQGVADMLHERAVAAMRERGWARARLFTPEGQARARRFYERRGWVHAGRAPAAVQGLGIPLVEYRLEVG